MFRIQRSEQRTDMIFLMELHMPDNACRARAGRYDAVQSGWDGERICNEMDVFRKAGEITESGTDLIVDRVV